jgi:integrase
LSILLNHACRYELFDRNPMRFVRQGAKRRSAPNVLTAPEIKALVDHHPLRERTLVLLAAATGLRQSELFGLKWRDVDLQHGELSVIRSLFSASSADARPSLPRRRFHCIHFSEKLC